MRHFLFFCIVPLLSFGQNRDSISYPDTIYFDANYYSIDDSITKTWGFYDKNSMQLENTTYDSIVYRFRAGLNLSYYEVKKNKLWGLLKSDRSPWIDIKYQKVDFEYKMNPQRISIQHDSLFGYLNVDGSIWLEPVYQEIMTDGETFKVKKNGKWGILSLDAKEIVPVCFSKLYEHISPELSLVSQEPNQWSIYRWIQGQNACKPAPDQCFERIEYFNEFFTVMRNKKWGLVDMNGKTMIELLYDDMKPFLYIYLRTLKVKQNEKYGLLKIDSLGKIETLVEISYDEIGIDEENYKIKVALGGKKDYLFEGKPFFNLAYEDVNYFQKYDLFSYKQGKKWGLINGQKQILLPAMYDKLHFIDNKTFMVQSKGKWGVVNQRNQILIPVEFTDFDFRKDGNFFFASKKDKWGIVSLKEGVLLDAKYDDVTVMPDGNFLVKNKNKLGIMGRSGREIAPIKFDRVNFNSNQNFIELIDNAGQKFKHNFKK